MYKPGEMYSALKQVGISAIGGLALLAAGCATPWENVESLTAKVEPLRMESRGGDNYHIFRLTVCNSGGDTVVFDKLSGFLNNSGIFYSEGKDWFSKRAGTNTLEASKCLTVRDAYFWTTRPSETMTESWEGDMKGKRVGVKYSISTGDFKK